jgi:putative oxidoreductase
MTATTINTQGATGAKSGEAGYDVVRNVAELLGRVLLASLFLASGLSKLTNYSGTAAYMASVGVAGAMLPFVIALEVGGALAIIAGWKTRAVSVLLAGFTLVTAFLFHLHPADQIQVIRFLKNISITGGFLFVAAHGAGAYSVDNRGRSKA